jgi:nitroreductase
MAEPNVAEPGIFEIMHTTRSMRRLKPDPVPDALIRKILEAGISAPNGGNMQRWRFLVIRDAKIKETVAGYYRRAWKDNALPEYRNAATAGDIRRAFSALARGCRLPRRASP